ncbi:cornifelin homolog A-like [Mya arenaria]|uniref:cornifelin homolog A-like n=1 Tax=Mya arenaria TaxID=6604 RepID=UPI0022E67874|nr:cornifelin homolog A-like [Mya arenaria]
MSNKWEHGLFSCFDDLGICILAYLVPCVIFKQNAEDMKEGECLVGGFVLFFPILGCYKAVRIRGKLREDNQIEGSTCLDVLTLSFCLPCALTQEMREIKDNPNITPIARE